MTMVDDSLIWSNLAGLSAAKEIRSTANCKFARLQWTLLSMHQSPFDRAHIHPLWH